MMGNISTRQRLVQGYEWLERLEAQSETPRHQILGKIVEHRIIWRELVDLELQDIDEQIAQIAARAA